MPASAGDIIVSLRGKTAQQVTAEIQAAAISLCREDGRVPLGVMQVCVDDLKRSTMSQLPASFGK
jgi:hypothetical protein